MADFAPLFHSADLVGQGGQACVLAPKGSQSAFKVRAGPTSCEPPPARPPAHCPTRLPSLSLRPSPQVSQVTSCLEDHVRQVGFEAGLAARLGQHGMAVPIATWLTWAVPRDVLGAQWGQDTQQPLPHRDPGDAAHQGLNPERTLPHCERGGGAQGSTRQPKHRPRCCCRANSFRHI